MEQGTLNPEMNLIIGVDGGQTSTKCVLMDSDGRVLGHGTGGALIHLAAQGSRERHVLAMREAVRSAFEHAQIAPRPLAAIGLGLTGVTGSASKEAQTVREYMPEVIEAGVVAVESDAYTALLGAHAGGAGVIAIGGTGSNVYGMNTRGEVQRAGGWGWLVGDEGSALWVGKFGLNAALHSHDGSGPRTLLDPMFLEHFNIAHYDDVKRIIYDTGFGSRGFASLAAVVSRAAAQGDGVAQGVIAQSAEGIARQVDAVVRKLIASDGSPDAPAVWPVAPVGGAFEHVHGLHNGFCSALQTLNTPCAIASPKLPPMFGAAIMAFRAAGLAWRGLV